MANRAQRRAQIKHSPSSGMSGRPVQPIHPTTSRGVVIAWLHPVGEVSARFMNSLMDLFQYDRDGALVVDEQGRQQRVGGHHHFMGKMPLSSGANIVTGRNKIVRQFLENDWGFDAQWLWFLDADMTFHADTLDRLLATADPIERPIVGGLCFALMKGEAQEIVPTIYGMSTQDNQLVRYTGYPQDAVVPVAATGAACLLIHRRVLETIRDRAWTEHDETNWQTQVGAPSGRALGEAVNPRPWPWFQETVTGRNWGDTLSEDLTFCLRAHQCGFPVVVDTSVKIGHQKPMVIDEDAYLRALPPDEGPAPTYVGIPVRGQHHYTTAILAQLVDQGGYEHIFIYDNAAETDPYRGELLERDDITVFNAEGWKFHRMWNEIIRESIARDQRCNIAILNNDLELGPDFLTELGDGLRAHPQFITVCGNYDNRQFAEKVQEVKGIAAGRDDGTGGWAGFGFMLRGEVFAAGLPLFDETYNLWYGDNDMLLMIEAAGGAYGIVRDAHMTHLGGGSNTSGDGVHRLRPEWRELVEADRLYFEQKWASQLVNA